MKKVTKTKAKTQAKRAKAQVKQAAHSQIEDLTAQVEAKAHDLTTKAQELTGKAVDQVVDYAAGLDYKAVAKNALKVAIPLVVMKMIHSKYQSSTKKSTSWEKTIMPLFDEIKSKLKDM